MGRMSNHEKRKDKSKRKEQKKRIEVNRNSDQAFVKVHKYFCTTRPLRKLAEKNLGPFTIIAQPGTYSITLQLLDFMKFIHLIFHILQLEPATQNTIPNHMQTPPPPGNIDGETEYEIKEILDLKINC